MHRRLAGTLALAVLAAALGGCVAIRSVNGVQLDVVGALRLTIVVCKVDNPTVVHPGCDLASNQPETTLNEGTAQLLVGFRVPAGVDALDSLAATTNDPASPALALSRSASYESELTRLLPPGAGRRWVGYLSETHHYTGGADGAAAREVTVTADLALPRPADGSPFVGPLAVRPVAGARWVAPTVPASDPAAPVACGDSATAITATGTVCVDSPLEAQLGADFAFATRDFGVLAGSATASPGQTVGLPFDVRGAGPLPAGLTATVTASTTLPGATAAPSQATVPLANGSSTRVTVPVAIPRDAGPGTFDVALAAQLSNGERRTGVAELTVRDRQAPVVSRLRVVPRRFRLGRRRGGRATAARRPRVAYVLSEDARVRFAVQRCVRRARRGRRRGRRCVRYRARGALVRTGREGANAFRLPARLRRRRLRPGAYRLVARARDAAGNRSERPARGAFVVRR